MKYEHVHLTSYSKMRVDLATQVGSYNVPVMALLTSTVCVIQVLSQSVSKALQFAVGDRANETSRFADMFDKFFDCLNCRVYLLGNTLGTHLSLHIGLDQTGS